MKLGRYGDVSRYRVGPRTSYFINHPELVHQILTHPKIVRTTLSRKLLGSFFPGLLTQEGAKHLQQRRLMQPAFHRRRLEHYAELMIDETDKQLSAWSSGSVQEMTLEMKELTFRIVSRALFSDAGDATRSVNGALDQLQASVMTKFKLYVALPNWLPVLSTAADRRTKATFTTIVQTLVNERRADPGDRGDLLSMLLEAQDEDGTRMTDEDIIGQSVTLLTAGHETTASTLAWALYLLGKHPEALAKLQAEVRGVLEDREPTLADLKSLSYTEWVIHETQRLYPVAWNAARVSSEPVELGGYTFEAGAPLTMSVYVTHRDERFFPDPETFDPERFSPERRSSIPKHAFLPFGAGSHICIGNAFALMEARLILARIVQRFDLNLKPGYVAELSPQITLGIGNGLPVELTAVNA